MAVSAISGRVSMPCFNRFMLAKCRIRRIGPQKHGSMALFALRRAL
jgi:hypothetical protein